MAKKKPTLDRAQAKAAKQKKLAIVLSVVFVLVLAFEVPKTMKAMHPKAKAPVITAGSASTPPASTPTTSPSTSTSTSVPPTATAAPSLPSSSSPSLVSAVQVSADPGQLTEFSEFASKDPFDQSVQKTPGAAGSSSAATGSKTKSSKPKTPPAPPPTSAVISLNGELMTVDVGSEFPTAGTVFDQVGSALFQLDSLTAKSAKVSIAGGSYASGAPTLTLTLGKPVTLQNTADGSRYTLLLEPPGTQVPSTTTSGATAATTPSVPATTTTTTTTPSVVPSGSG